jgi:hypothetical protein
VGLKETHMLHPAHSVHLLLTVGLLAAPVALSQGVSPLDACAFRLTVTQLYALDSILVRNLDFTATLRPPTGFHLVVASLRGNAAGDTVVNMSSDGFALHHVRGVADARALAFVDGTTPPEQTTFSGGGAEISRALRRGPFTLYVGFLVPNIADEAAITHVCRLPGVRRIGR